MEYKVVNIIKTINPEKKGDPMKLSFGKDWYNSCDEAQRKIIGEVAYKTYIITNTIFMSIFLAVVLVSKYIDVGIFSIILIAAINIINVAVYGILSIKTEYKNVK